MIAAGGKCCSHSHVVILHCRIPKRERSLCCPRAICDEIFITRTGWLSLQVPLQDLYAVHHSSTSRNSKASCWVQSRHNNIVDETKLDHRMLKR